MTTMPFMRRDCPSCGGKPAPEEVRSKPRAERLKLDDLRPFWSGLFKEKVFFSYARCQNCALLFAPAFFTDDQLTELYAAMAPNMADVSTSSIAATQKTYFDIALSAVSESGGDYLEVGPDVGYIVKLAAESGRFERFWLFEPNQAVHDSLASAVSGQSYNISEGMTDLSHVPGGSVSLAVMVHVLDHLLDPVAMLRQIRAKLKPNGALVIVTHNEKSTLRHLMGQRFPPFCLQHPQLFNPTSIKSALATAGFAEVKVARSLNYFSIAFMLRQAAYTARIDLTKVPLPSFNLGLRLGNIITVARAGD